MKFSKSITFAAPPEKVFALLGDRAFREEVCQAAGAESYDVKVAPTESGLDSTIETTSPADGMPSVVKKILGSTLTLRQTETWDSPTSGTISVSIPGTPGEIFGTLELAPGPGGAVQTVEADIKVGIPLVGRKIEQMIGSGLGHVLKVQARVAADWLSR